MYCTHFGLNEKPFEITPDPKYLFLSPSHKEMLASLVYGIRQRRGFIAVIGEVGTGKTTLLNAAVDQIDELTKVAYICNTSMDFEQILHQILLELGVTESREPLSRIQSINLLNELAIQQLARGGNVVLIVDEAQNLNAAAMENLRLLSNLETRKHKLIQIILAGQPELDKKLGLPELRQLAQRIGVRRTITPLTEKETSEYLQYRLNLAGYGGPPLFAPGAQRLIYEFSRGIPRKINILCDNSLLIGYAVKQKKIVEAFVEESARDLNWTLPSAPIEILSGETTSPPPTPVAAKKFGIGSLFTAMFGAAFLLAVGAWVFFAHSGYTLKPPQPRAPAQQVEQAPQSQAITIESSPRQAAGNLHRKDEDRFPVRSLTPPQAAENALAIAVQPAKNAPPSAGAGDGDKDGVPTNQGADRPNFGIDRRIAAEPEKTEENPLPIATTSRPPDLDTGLPAPDKKPEITLPRPAPSIQPADMPVSILEKIADALKPATASREVTVAPGDTLYSIIHRAYGTYDGYLLDAVMKQNPEIPSPNRIVAGQVIRLPDYW